MFPERNMSLQPKDQNRCSFSKDLALADITNLNVSWRKLKRKSYKPLSQKVSKTLKEPESGRRKEGVVTQAGAFSALIFSEVNLSEA